MKTKTQLISKALRIAGKAANTEEVEIRIGKYFYSKVCVLTQNGEKWVVKCTPTNLR